MSGMEKQLQHRGCRSFNSYQSVNRSVNKSDIFWQANDQVVCKTLKAYIIVIIIIAFTMHFYLKTTQYYASANY